MFARASASSCVSVARGRLRAKIRLTATATAIPQAKKRYDEECPPAGEWEGHLVDFVIDENSMPIAQKLPSHVIPPAYGDWEVDVYDWQTQCAMVVMNDLGDLRFKDMKFIPVAGCEVDASVIHEQIDSEYTEVDHFGDVFGDFNWHGRESVTHVMCRQGGTFNGYRDSEPFIRVRITQNREKKNEIKVWREAYYEKYTNGASLVASCGGTKNTMKYGEYPRSEVNFSEMDGVPNKGLVQNFNGLDIWSFIDLDSGIFSCGWKIPNGEHIISERVLAKDGSKISSKITRAMVVG
jgi:hypothetical protein